MAIVEKSVVYLGMEEALDANMWLTNLMYLSMYDSCSSALSWFSFLFCKLQCVFRAIE